MTEILHSGWTSQTSLWSLDLILGSTSLLVSVADSTNLFVESGFDFGLHKTACVGCRLHKNRGSV